MKIQEISANIKTMLKNQMEIILLKKNRISEKFKIYWMGRMEIVKRKSVNLEKDKYKNIINMHNRVKLLRINNKEKILKAARIKYHANIGEQ